MCICILMQHRSIESGVPGRAAAAWSCLNTAHMSESVRPAAAGSCLTTLMRETVILPSSSAAGTSFSTAYGETVLAGSSAAGLYSHIHIRICVIM